MIPPTVMTIEDWDRDIRPDPERYAAMVAWLAACGVDADATLAVALTEGGVSFVMENAGAWRHPAFVCGEFTTLDAMAEIEVAVPGAPLPPFWHGRRHSLVDEARPS